MVPPWVQGEEEWGLWGSPQGLGAPPRVWVARHGQVAKQQGQALPVPPTLRTRTPTRTPRGGGGRARRGCCTPPGSCRGRSSPRPPPVEAPRCALDWVWHVDALRLGRQACGIFVPQPGIKLSSPALQGRFLTTGLPGKSLSFSFCIL